MGDFILRLKSLEFSLANTAAANTVSNAALVRCVPTANVTVIVANAGVNVGSATLVGGVESYIQKWPQDTIQVTPTSLASVNVTSVSFRD